MQLEHATYFTLILCLYALNSTIALISHKHISAVKIVLPWKMPPTQCNGVINRFFYKQAIYSPIAYETGCRVLLKKKSQSDKTDTVFFRELSLLFYIIRT